MAGSVAIKRLSSVEVDTTASHQREFHADALGRELGLRGDRLEGQLLASYYPVDGEPVAELTTYTYYQARKPPRSEFRLYPKTNLFLRRASAGDLLLVFRRPDREALRMVVAARGSEAERQVLDAFFAGDVPALERFQFPAPQTSDPEAQQLGLALIPAPPSIDQGVRSHTAFGWALEHGRYPTTASMATAAREIADVTFGAGLDPDAFLDRGLEAETHLFFAIEQQLAEVELRTLIANTADVAAVLEWSIRRLNARKSRRGRSLQNHFEALLDREGIPYTPECITEAPPPVDIMVPSATAYGDPTFPAERLRAVSCKSTLKERWMEIIPEARRVPMKYLLTLDDNITDNVIQAMSDARVRAFLPARVRAAYTGRSTAHLLSSVTDLVNELRATAT